MAAQRHRSSVESMDSVIGRTFWSPTVPASRVHRRSLRPQLSLRPARSDLGESSWTRACINSLPIALRSRRNSDRRSKTGSPAAPKPSESFAPCNRHPGAEGHIGRPSTGATPSQNRKIAPGHFGRGPFLSKRKLLRPVERLNATNGLPILPSAAWSGRIAFTGNLIGFPDDQCLQRR